MTDAINLPCQIITESDPGKPSQANKVCPFIMTLTFLCSHSLEQVQIYDQKSFANYHSDNNSRFAVCSNELAFSVGEIF